MTLHAITVLGHDRPGIIAEATDRLAGLGLNLEDSTMTLLRGHFAMMLVCEGSAADAEIESALALGATRWEVIRMTVIPFGMSGFIAGSMLGLGRALGETMALYMAVAPANDFRGSLFDGGTTFATAIANASAEFNNPVSAGAYIAAGLVLFLLTFVVNSIARAIVNK